MAITSKAWDGSPSRWPDTDAFCASCAIDSNSPGQKKILENCKLPYKEPNGDINTNALSAAAAALNGARGGLTGVSPADKKKAAKTLVRAYAQAQMDAPPALKSMAQ